MWISQSSPWIPPIIILVWFVLVMMTTLPIRTSKSPDKMAAKPEPFYPSKLATYFLKPVTPEDTSSNTPKLEANEVEATFTFCHDHLPPKESGEQESCLVVVSPQEPDKDTSSNQSKLEADVDSKDHLPPKEAGEQESCLVVVSPQEPDKDTPSNQSGLEAIAASIRQRLPTGSNKVPFVLKVPGSKKDTLFPNPAEDSKVAVVPTDEDTSPHPEQADDSNKKNSPLPHAEVAVASFIKAGLGSTDSTDNGASVRSGLRRSNKTKRSGRKTGKKLKPQTSA